jgi:hypothetical protein
VAFVRSNQVPLLGCVLGMVGNRSMACICSCNSAKALQLALWLVWVVVNLECSRSLHALYVLSYASL